MGGSPPTMWDTLVQPTEAMMFQEHSKCVRVPHTDYVRICLKCQSQGLVDCGDCDGSGKTTCRKCCGNAMMKCRQCKGTGQCTRGCTGVRISSNLFDFDVPCVACGGTAECGACSGTGPD